MDPLDLLSENLNLYTEMKELAVEQETLITREDMNPFMGLAARREHLQRQIEANDRQYNQFAKASHTRSTDPKLSRLRQDLIRMIRSIQEIDKKIEDGLTQKKELSLSEIKQIRKGHKAVRGYGHKSVRPPRFIDKKG